MSEISATDAARNFADLLNAIEHHGEHYTIVRRGKAVARLEPMSHGQGSDTKKLLRRHRPDSAWREDLNSVRALLEIEDRT